MRSPILLSVVLTVFISCNNSSKPADVIADVKKAPRGAPVFDKLVGTWKMEDGKGFERWSKLDNGTYNSVVFSLKGTDTSWEEHANIYPENERWVFENAVANQNGGKAVKFVSSLLNEQDVQFSNPAHDFPTDVHYSVTDNNTVHAFIIGPNNKGGRDTIPFNYTRYK